MRTSIALGISRNVAESEAGCCARNLRIVFGCRSRKASEAERLRQEEEALMEARRKELMSEENGYWRRRMAQDAQVCWSLSSLLKPYEHDLLQVSYSHLHCMLTSCSHVLVLSTSGGQMY